MDDNPRVCPSCGVPSGRLKRRDYYLSLFFIPLFPVKRGEPFIECQRCGGVFDSSGRPAPGPAEPSNGEELCPACRRPIQPHFVYCPFCGRRL